MPNTIAELDEHLTRDLGWTSNSVAFGRQSWKITTTDGYAEAEAHVDGDGIVGSFRLVTVHPRDDEEEPWDEEHVELKVSPTRVGALPIHRPESEVVSALARYAAILDATVEVGLRPGSYQHDTHAIPDED